MKEPELLYDLDDMLQETRCMYCFWQLYRVSLYVPIVPTGIDFESANSLQQTSESQPRAR
jgi:hypothetical protein